MASLVTITRGDLPPVGANQDDLFVRQSDGAIFYFDGLKFVPITATLIANGATIPGGALTNSVYAGLYIGSNTITASTAANGAGIWNAPSFDVSSNGIGLIGGTYANPSVTIDAGITLVRIASYYGDWTAPAGAGSVQNAVIVYCGTPSGGTGSTKVIDSASGGYLSTAGAWTNNPSWAKYKSDIRYVDGSEMAGVYDWFVNGWKPARYRHEGIALEPDGPAPIHQDYEYDSFFALLDDIPENVREIICADPQGGISTKDTDGFILALLQEQGRRIQALTAALEKSTAHG